MGQAYIVRSAASILNGKAAIRWLVRAAKVMAEGLEYKYSNMGAAGKSKLLDIDGCQSEP